MRECSAPGCHVLLKAAGRCEVHANAKLAEVRRADKARGSANDRGYTSQWSKARKGYLAKHPLCVRCESSGIIQSANVVDHVQPHKGDVSLFWNVDNWQSLCYKCHNIKTAREDGGWGRNKI